MEPVLLKKDIRKMFATSVTVYVGASAQQVTKDVVTIVSSMEIYSKYPAVQELMKNFEIMNMSFDITGGNADDKTEKTEAVVIIDGKIHELHYSSLDNWSYGRSRASLDWNGVNILKEFENIRTKALKNFCDCALALNLADLSIEEVTELFIRILSPIALTRSNYTSDYHPFKTAFSEIRPSKKQPTNIPIKDLKFTTQSKAPTPLEGASSKKNFSSIS